MPATRPRRGPAPVYCEWLSSSDDDDDDDDSTVTATYDGSDMELDSDDEPPRLREIRPPPLTKDDTRALIVDAVRREAGIAEVIMLDSATWGYTRALQGSGYDGSILVVERDEAKADILYNANRANGITVKCDDIINVCAQITPRQSKKCAVLLDLYGFISEDKLTSILKRQPRMLTITQPAGRTHPDKAWQGCQAKRTRLLTRLVDSHGYYISHAIGYDGEPDPEHPQRTGQRMMYYEIHNRRYSAPRGPTRRHPLRISPPRRAAGGQLLCEVRWAGYGDAKSTMSAAYYDKWACAASHN